MSKRSVLPTVAVSSKGAQRLRRFSPWCYRTELTGPPDTDEPGAIVQVVDAQQNPVCQAFYAQRSPLALRLLTREPADKKPINESFFRERLEQSLARRQSLRSRDAYRLVHGEADLLPGLFVDKYGDALTLQTLSEGADARKDLFARLLRELTGARQIVVRDDASGRDFEGLPRERRLLFGDPPARTTFREGENRFEVDLLEDMKTGSFLDQVDNHLRAGALATGEGLDLFSYHGGFALALADACTKVTAIEQDPTAAKRATHNAEMNGKKNVTVQEANAFDVLRAMEKEQRKFDTIVLDPPGLAKRKEGVSTALRAYHELNLRAMKCVKPGGLLVTCSCSGKLGRDDFERMLLTAAADAKRPLQILERRGAGIDHPVLASLPETEYLKAFFVRVL